MSTIYVLALSMPSQPPVVAAFHTLPRPDQAMAGLRAAIGHREEYVDALTLPIPEALQTLDPNTARQHFTDQLRQGLHAGMCLEMAHGVMLSLQMVAIR